MDDVQTEQSQQEEKRSPSVFEEIEFGMGGILLGVGTFLLMLFVLNYFNIVSLSLVFPNQLGWLPHRASPNPPAGGEGGLPLQGPTSKGVNPMQPLIHLNQLDKKSLTAYNPF